jgi:hypothetical protein
MVVVLSLQSTIYEFADSDITRTRGRFVAPHFLFHIAQSNQVTTAGCQYIDDGQQQQINGAKRPL